MAISYTRSQADRRLLTGRRAISGDTTLDNTDYLVSVDTSGGPVTITLPTVLSVGQNFSVIIKDDSNNAATNNITVARSGLNTIDGETSFVISLDGACVEFISDGLLKWQVR